MVTWAAIEAGASIVGVAFSMMNAVDEFEANRIMKKELEAIKTSLRRIESTVNRVEEHCKNVLARLDIVVQELGVEFVKGMLGENYSRMNAARSDFLLYDDGEQILVRSAEWIRISDAMQYLFEHEYRVSALARLLEASETALLLTRGRAAKRLIPLLEDKLDEYDSLLPILKNNALHSLKSLAALVDTTKYVVSHGLLNNVPETLFTFKFVLKPNREKKKRVTERKCETHIRGSRDNDYYVTTCKDVRKTIDVPDKRFSQLRDAHGKAILAAQKVAIQRVRDLDAYRKARDVIERYLEGIRHLEHDDTLYFLEPGDGPRLNAKPATKPVEVEDLIAYAGGEKLAEPPKRRERFVKIV